MPFRLKLGNTSKTNIEYTLSGTGLKPYFDVIVGGEDVKQGKPDPEIFLMTARQLGIPAPRCLVFEDALLGIEAACQAGMKAVAITTTLRAKDFVGLCPVVEIASDFLDLHPSQFVRLF